MLEKFEGHFVQRKNVIFERAKFNKREQGETEPVDAFVTDLYAWQNIVDTVLFTTK